MKFLIVLSALLLVSCGSNVNTGKKTETTPPASTAPVVANNNPTAPSGPAVPAPVVEAPKPPIITISGFQKGNQYNVDGPLWYDGTASVDELSPTEMRVNISMAAPDVGLPYQVKEGKINIVIKITKDSSNYNLYLIDNNKNKAFWVPNVKFETGKTNASWFSAAKEYAKVTASTQYYEFQVNSESSIYISTNAMPGGLTLTKK